MLNSATASYTKRLSTTTCSLYLGNQYCLLAEMPDMCVDIIFSRPPYFRVGGVRDRKPQFIGNVVNEFKRILKPTGNIIMFCSYTNLPIWYQYSKSLFEGVQFMNWYFDPHRQGKPMATFTPDCEFILGLRNEHHIWNASPADGLHDIHNNLHCCVPEVVDNKKKEYYPTNLNGEIIKHVIELSSNPGDVLLDPFMRYGKIGLEALEIKRKFIGFGKLEAGVTYVKQKVIEGMNRPLFSL